MWNDDLPPVLSWAEDGGRDRDDDRRIYARGAADDGY